MKNLKEFIKENISKSFTFEKNPYPLLYIDLLSECNMNCNICYNDKMPKTYLKLDEFEHFLKAIPKNSYLRFLGGEPTLHPEFFELLRMAREYKNFIAIASNGLKYRDKDFMKELSKPVYNNRACGYAITLNGGFRVDHPAWKVIDNDPYVGPLKWEALHNMLDFKIRNIGLTAIILRGVNEDIIKPILNFAHKYERISHVRLRSAGINLTQSNLETDIYTSKDFRTSLLPPLIGDNIKTICSGLKKDDQRCNECCYEIRDRDIVIKHIEFGTPGANNCWKRGWVDFKEGLIYPFFEYEELKAKYYEQIENI